nr:MAG TPA: hypothetical protein [Bacteriophage sp.]
MPICTSCVCKFARLRMMYMCKPTPRRGLRLYQKARRYYSTYLK